MSQILIPILIVGGMGILFGGILGVASKIFAVKVDERVPQILEILPGANCGNCGFAGCSAYANALCAGGVKTNLCPACSGDASEKIAEILGVEADESEKMVARVRCSGSTENAALKYIYDGPCDCHSAAKLGGGEKLCSFACLGFGSCVKACRFDAISVQDGVAIVDEEKCVGCGGCVKECPKNVIALMPAKSKYAVACQSAEKGKFTRQNCQVGCIGCGICAKNCPKDAITVENNIAVINQEKCVGCGICASKCPRKIIKLYK